jgi:hypothetical protein
MLSSTPIVRYMLPSGSMNLFPRRDEVALQGRRW